MTTANTVTTTASRAKKVATDAAVETGATVKQAAETTARATQDAVTKNYEQAVALTKEQVEKASKKAFEAYEELTAFNKDTVDAFVLSSTVLAKGLENLSKSFVAYAQSSLESSVSATKALLAVKSLREAVDQQSEFAKASFDSLVSEATKTSELSVKLANEAIEPISARVNAVVTKFGKPRLAA
ncbi:MAG: TIGR01841 family phasin [Azospirillaceae bacterium]|nr:TIGR01841 family phasin [Azospirillaceae bacterium]